MKVVLLFIPIFMVIIYAAFWVLGASGGKLYEHVSMKWLCITYEFTHVFIQISYFTGKKGKFFDSDLKKI